MYYKCWTQVLDTRCKSGAHWAEIISVSLELATHLLSCQTTFYTLRSANIIQNIADMHKRFDNISSTCLYICSILTVYFREFNTFEYKGIRHICCVYLVYIATYFRALIKKAIMINCLQQWENSSHNIQIYTKRRWFWGTCA